MTVGSSERCDLSLSDRAVSRRHLVAEKAGVGVRVVDQGSRNGTWMGDCRVGEVELVPGATIRLGGSVLQVEVGKGVEVGRGDEVERLPGMGASVPGHGGSRPSRPQDHFGRFVGSSVQVQPMYAQLAKVAPTDATVLLEGESGSGKELLAEAIHERSRRASAPFIVVDCGAIAETLIEAELFGHERGAFTGADKARAGAFERAHGGTVFLDEIGELPIGLQTRLLRVLDRRHVARIGSSQRIDIDVRVIAATNRNLEHEVEESRFRLDLYHRLAVVEIRVPPLRERDQDVELLARRFATTLGAEANLISPEVVRRLRSHAWPGNARELRNYVERLVLLGEHAPELRGVADPFNDAARSGLPFRQARASLLDSFTSAYVEDMLQRHDGNVSRAAAAAGVARRYFYRLKGQ